MLSTAGFLLMPSAPVFAKAWDALAGPERNGYPALLIVAAAAAYQIEYGLNFVFSSYVDPLTFSVADISRRLAIILVGTVLFDKQLTSLNIAGIALALLGVLSYNVLNQRQERKAREGRNPKRV